MTICVLFAKEEAFHCGDFLKTIEIFKHAIDVPENDGKPSLVRIFAIRRAGRNH